MNDAKSMLMMYSYAAMKAAEDKEETKTKAEKESFCEVIESDSDFVSRGDIVYTDPYTRDELCETDYAVYILDEDDILCRKEN